MEVVGHKGMIQGWIGHGPTTDDAGEKGDRVQPLSWPLPPPLSTAATVRSLCSVIKLDEASRWLREQQHSGKGVDVGVRYCPGWSLCTYCPADVLLHWASRKVL